MAYLAKKVVKIFSYFCIL